MKAPARREACAPGSANTLTRSTGPPYHETANARRSRKRDQMKFSELGLSEKVLKAVEASGYDTPTPI